MKKLRENIPVWAYCWTNSTGRCKNFSCAITFKKCKNFVDMRWKIHRYNNYHKRKPKYPISFVEFVRKRVNSIYKL